ncbi:thylakoid membrane photosystem I accumulation factor [Coleofasciculus sp. H7-2]|uniref:thylakoid membrane photosystem I accumulation factor n=1 Tax=Coleofasciculus sp. H7-2 TaxID=3351545 RepID=UPI00366E407B
MILRLQQFQIRILRASRRSWRQFFLSCLLTLVVSCSCLLLATPSALAGINDDNFDGNVFLLYGGNGSLVPPRVALADSIKGGKPALLVFYVDDSSDCKQQAIVVSQLQAFYGRAADFSPIDVDAIPVQSNFTPTEPGYYYEGVVPQTVLLNQKGEVVLNQKGTVPFEKVDDVFREVFNLLPRSESVALKRRSVNEFNTELAK